MFYIRKATTADIPLINHLAQQVFPETYKNILSSEQIAYMMDWMYSPESLRKQMEEEGHTYYIAYEECEAAGYVSIQPLDKDLFELQKPCLMELRVNRHNPALGFYEHMGMKKLREDDCHIGNGYYMNDYIMGLDIR